tara:strand:- start:276 stop:662 length:387 start_codon:yes stop_codon:yes gene_type:complete
MKYDIYQIQLTEEQRDDINSSEVMPKWYKSYMDMRMNAGESAIMSILHMYKPVATIEAKDLDDVFEIGNIGPESAIERLDRMSSISVGDIIISYTGTVSLVKSLGFEEMLNVDKNKMKNNENKPLQSA